MGTGRDPSILHCPRGQETRDPSRLLPFYYQHTICTVLRCFICHISWNFSEFLHRQVWSETLALINPDIELGTL